MRAGMLLAGVLAAGCAGSGPPATGAGGPPPVAGVARPAPRDDPPPKDPAAGPKPAPAYPREQAAFRAGALGLTRDQVRARYGPPAKVVDDDSGLWDGPFFVYDGPFAGGGGAKEKGRLWFRRTALGDSVVDLVDFED